MSTILHIDRSGHPSRRRRRSRGVTLMELLVVLGILALIAVIAVPMYLNHLSKSRTRTAGIQIERLGAILDSYLLDVGRYPTQEEGMEALLTAPSGVDRWAGPYLKNREALTDPWGAPYIYVFPGKHGKYDLYTLGADGREGGDDENRDITSW